MFDKLRAYNEACLRNNEIPRVTDFCIKNDMTMTEFEEMKDSPEFSREAEITTQIQLDMLLVGGLTGSLNSQFAMFVLRSLFGFRDKGESKQIGENRIIYLPKELEEMYKEASE